MNKKKRLGDLLFELGYITEEQVNEAIKIQKTTGKRLGRIFVELGYITEESLLNILELQLGIPRINLDLIDVDMNAISTISEGLALGVSKEENIKLYRPVGCSKCSGTGYKGRTGIFEIMEVKKNIRELITNGANFYEISDEAKKNGMKTLFESGVEVVKKGASSMNELMKITLIEE